MCFILSLMHSDNATDNNVDFITFVKRDIILLLNSSKERVDTVDNKEHFSVARISTDGQQQSSYQFISVVGKCY